MTTFLSDSELTQLRADALFLIPDTCQILKKTNSVDSYGGVIETFTAQPAVSCRADPIERTEGIFGGQMFEREGSKAWYKFWFVYNEDVDFGDKILKDGIQFEIVRVFGEQTASLFKQVYAVVVEGDNE